MSASVSKHDRARRTPVEDHYQADRANGRCVRILGLVLDVVLSLGCRHVHSVHSVGGSTLEDSDDSPPAPTAVARPRSIGTAATYPTGGGVVELPVHDVPLSQHGGPPGLGPSSSSS